MIYAITCTSLKTGELLTYPKKVCQYHTFTRWSIYIFIFPSGTVRFTNGIHFGVTPEEDKKGLHLMLQAPTTIEGQESVNEPPLMPLEEKSDVQNDRTVTPESPLDEGFAEPNKELPSNSSGTVGSSVDTYDMYNFCVLLAMIFDHAIREKIATITIDETFFKLPGRQTTCENLEGSTGNERDALKARPDKKRFAQRNPEQNAVPPLPDIHVYPEPNIPVKFETIETNPAGDTMYDKMDPNNSVDRSNEDVTASELVTDTSSEYVTCSDEEDEPLDEEVDSNTGE